jgi:hypothetical protein
VRNHTVEIGDRAGHSFKIEISTLSALGLLKDALAGNQKEFQPRITGVSRQREVFYAKPDGDWRVADKGFIRYNSGTVARNHSGKGDLTTSDVMLLNLDGTWGMKLFEYEDQSGVNDEGEGFVIQPWVLGFPPGKFSWTLR